MIFKTIFPIIIIVFIQTLHSNKLGDLLENFVLFPFFPALSSSLLPVNGLAFYANAFFLESAYNNKREVLR